MDTEQLTQEIGLLALNGELGPKGVYMAKELVELEAWGTIQGILDYHQTTKNKLAVEKRVQAHFAAYGDQI